MLVVEASAVTELVLGRPAGDVVAEQFAGHGFALHAPHLVDVEVLSALRRLVSSGEATTERGCEAIADHPDLPIERAPPMTFSCRPCGNGARTSPPTTRATSRWRRRWQTGPCRC